MRELPTGTVTFLFTDVEGSTRLLHELGADAYADALADHRRVIREACVAHDGSEVDTQGDAFFFAFPTAPGAIAAASEMTARLASGVIQVRIGLHTGTPLLTGEGYVGDDVHFAARVASSGHGSQVIVSAATAELVALELTDLGEHRLKDIPQAVPIFQLGDGSFPPLKTISNTNLPRPASSFVGRDDELVEVLSRIEDGARLLTLTGPGGTGKTRLAIEAASELVPSYKAGVFWVGLASLRDPALVTETIAQTLGAKDGLADHIGEREMLLLLDNLEQVVDAAPELADLLEACPSLRLLVTSRELLRVRGEVEYAVPPLAETDAVSLFCVRSQLQPSDEIAELCRRLDDLPLAVELAAARTTVLTPAQILERLSQRLDLLEGGRDADARQHTLRATIEWSYDLLSPEEQQLFARLSVFNGGCPLEAAEEVAAANIDTLQSLAEKSLLRLTDERYWMLETIREYAAERLANSGARDEFESRHAEYFAQLADRMRAVQRDGGTAWLDALRREQDNFRLTFRHLTQAGLITELYDVLGFVLQRWWTHGELAEGLRICRDALARGPRVRTEGRGRTLKLAGIFADNVGEHEAARAYMQESLAIFRELEDDDQIATVLINLGASLGATDPEEARTYLEEAIARARRAGAAKRVAIAGANLANIELDAGNFELAISQLEEVVRVEREAGDDIGVVNPLFNLAFAYLRTGREDVATTRAREGLEVGARLGDVRGISNHFDLAANVAAVRGDARAGALLTGAARGVRERMGSRVLLGDHLTQFVDETVAMVRDELGDGYAPALEEGRTMPFDDAVRLALASID